MAVSFQIDKSYLQEHLAAMVKIDSRNPTLFEGAPGELELGNYLKTCLEALGLVVEVHTLAPNRVNVLARLKGQGTGKTLMLNGHMDTVGTEGMQDAFSGRIAASKLYGRGSQDMKGSLAAMLTSLKALKDANIELKGDLILAFVADEEALSIGTEHLVKTYRADAAIITEPTDMKLGTAHRGFIWFELDVFGRAAHGSRYSDGVDANMHMGLFLAELYSLSKDLLQRPAHPLAGPPSLHVSQMQGGSEKSTYAAHSKVIIERRTRPGETLEQAQGEIQAILDKLAQTVPNFQANLKADFVRLPFESHPDARIVEVLQKVAQSQFGQRLEPIGLSFWTDAALLAEAGIETVLLGPVGQGLHSQEEWVDLDSLYDLSRLLTQLTVDYCELKD